MIRSRFLSAFLLSCLVVFSVLAGSPTLTFPEDMAGDQPSDLTLTWEAAALTNYVVNGDFEKASGGWAFSGLWGQTLSTDSQPAYAGDFFARTVLNRASVNSIVFQPIRLPAVGSAVRLSWSDHTSGVLASGGGELDSRIHWQVTTTLDGSAPVYERTAGDNDGPGWQRHQVDISAFLGQLISLEFRLYNRGVQGAVADAILDDVRIEVIPKSVKYDVYLGSTPNMASAKRLGRTTDTSWDLSGLAPGSTNYWEVIQFTDGVVAVSPVFQFVVGGSVPVEAPPLLVRLGGGQLHLHAATQAGGFYQFEQADDPGSGSWQSVGDEITGDGTEASLDVPLDTEAQFFRLRVTR